MLDTGYRALHGARVEVLDGAQAGTFTTADATGQFSLSGEFDSTTRFRATHQGNVTATHVWSCSVDGCPINGARPWLGFYLEVLAPPVNLTGDYTLTVIADTACADFPNQARTRTYAATIAPAAHLTPITPAQTSFHVTVSGATFLGTFDGFGIGVAEDYVDLWLDGGHDPPVVEQLSANTYLALSGNATASNATMPVSTISATFDGWIEYCVANAPMSAGYNCGTSNVTGEEIPGAAVSRKHCQSPNHRVILTRR